MGATDLRMLLPRLDLHLFSGQQDDRNDELGAGAIGKNLMFGANLYFRLAPNVLLGPEVSQSRTVYIGRAYASTITMIWRWLICSSVVPGRVVARRRSRAGGAHQLAGPGGAPQQDYSGVVLWLEPVGRARGPAAPPPRHARDEAAGQDLQAARGGHSGGRHGGFPNLDPFFHNAFSNFAGQPSISACTRPAPRRSVTFRRARHRARLLQHSSADERHHRGGGHAVVHGDGGERPVPHRRTSRRANTSCASFTSAPCRKICSFWSARSPCRRAGSPCR